MSSVKQVEILVSSTTRHIDSHKEAQEPQNELLICFCVLVLFVATLLLSEKFARAIVCSYVATR